MAAQAGQTEAFGDHALAGEGRVAVEQKRQHLFALPVPHLILLGADLAKHHGIDALKMRGVGGERQVHAVLVELAVGRGAQVIFHVTRAFDIVGLGGAAAELVEDGAVGLGHDVGEHVEAPAVRHADDDLAHAELAAALDDLLERRNHGFAAVQAEALGAGVFDVEEALGAFRLDELGEDGAFALLREAHLLVRALDALLDPGALLGVGDVHVLEADRSGIGPLQDVEHLAQGGELVSEGAADIDGPVVVVLGEAVRLGF